MQFKLIIDQEKDEEVFITPHNRNTLIDEIHSEILSPKKEVNELLLQPDSGP